MKEMYYVLRSLLDRSNGRVWAIPTNKQLETFESQVSDGLSHRNQSPQNWSPLDQFWLPKLELLASPLNRIEERSYERSSRRRLFHWTG